MLCFAWLLASEDCNCCLNWFPNGSHVATAPSRIRPLWILLLSELSEASEEEALGIFFSNVVCFFMCCFSLIIFCSLLCVKKKKQKQKPSLGRHSEERRTDISLVGIGKGERTNCGFSPLPTPLFLLRFLCHRCGHCGHSLWVNAVPRAAAGFPLFWELLPRRDRVRVAGQCLPLLPCQATQQVPSRSNRGGARRSGKGTGRGGSGRPGGGKLNRDTAI